ncbi:biopolymer transporter ExbD [Winogradskyella eckloniae]|uniref:ExbD/TolR family protein n=1 Tax=Winogradskyella eckloniae TaxID=1089306 RepID=UPI00156589FD|nr:biopolymer transporter ExbD [Winogradskyella eckloniae]NRD20008.1 biopolymer transporter ExbD [Winogradskyella eckloniae]
MKSFRRHSASVNAGSMADIAFLLLIFFLVTTTISADKGILRQLPKICETANCVADIAERNLLRISVNDNQQILIDDAVVKLSEIQTTVEAFLDNNCLGTCDYCEGLKVATSADHPKKAVISLSHSPQTTYEYFIAVQDEITKAYYNLRVRYAKHKYNKAPEALTKTELKDVQSAFPFIVSEIMVKPSN